jgi:hypothetical protein
MFSNVQTPIGLGLAVIVWHARHNAYSSWTLAQYLCTVCMPCMWDALSTLSECKACELRISCTAA